MISPPDKYRELFLEEANKQIQSLNQNLLSLEKDFYNLELIHNIFRAVHSLKGAVGFVNLTELGQLLHVLENLLQSIRDKKIHITQEIINTIFKCLDEVTLSIQKFAEQENQTFDFKRLLVEISNYTGLKQSDDLFFQKETSRKNFLEQESSEGLKTKGENQREPLKKPRQPSLREKKVRVPIKKLDQLSEMIGELTVINSRFISLYKKMDEVDKKNFLNDRLESYFTFISRLSARLQKGMLRVRQINLKEIFFNYPRLVRDLAQKNNKKITLIIEGETIEVDRAILDDLNEIIIQLIRNSIDHGIETEEERGVKNKPVEGQIKIKAFKQEEEIIIQVEDDGQGLDPNLIKETLLRKELVSLERIKEMNLSEIYASLFWPGFSTKKEVSDLSGRGVGLNIVKEIADKINAEIKVESVLKKGTKFNLILASSSFFDSSIDSDQNRFLQRNFNFTSQDLAPLEKVIHFGMNKAFSLFSELLREPVEFSLPKIDLSFNQEKLDYLGKVDNIYIGVLVEIQGDLKGHFLLIFEEEIGFELIDLLYGFKSSRELNEEGSSALKEMANILGSNILTFIADQTQLIIRPTVPVVIHDYLQTVLDSISVIHQKNLMVNTSFSLVRRNKTLGNFFFMPTLGSLKKVIDSLQKQV